MKINVIGILFVVGGIAYAFYNPSDEVLSVPIGMWVALVGSGIIDPAVVLKFLSRRSGP